MADTDNSNLKRFTPQLKTVVDMTARTIKANTPMFILVSYQHNNDKQYFIEQLGKQLADKSLTMSCYDPKNNSKHESVYRLMAEDSQKQRLSVVASMPEDERFELDIGFVKYININRDNITRCNLRWLLFVKDHQMGDFIDIAPDLWSFRIETMYLEREDDIDSLEKVEPRADLDLMWRNIDVSFAQSSFSDEEKKDIAEHIAQSKELIGQTKDDLDKVRQLLNLVEWLYRHDVYDLTREVAMEALTLLDSINSCRDWGNIKSINSLIGVAQYYYHFYSRIAFSYKESGNYSYAIEYFNRNLVLVSHESEQFAEINIQLAYCHGELGDFDVAIKKCELAVSLAEQFNNKRLMIDGFYHMAAIYTDMKLATLAIKYHEKSLHIALAVGDGDMQAGNYIGLANVYYVESNYEKAIDYYQRALKHFGQSNDKHGEIACLHNIGRTLIAEKNYHQARGFFIEALRIIKNLNHIFYLACINFDLANCSYELAEYPQALKYAKEALPLLTQITSPDVEKTENLIKELEQKLKEQSNS